MKLFLLMVQVALIAQYSTNALPFSIPDNLISEITKKLLPAVDSAWTQFKKDFKKEYADEIEAIQR